MKFVTMATGVKSVYEFDVALKITSKQEIVKIKNRIEIILIFLVR